MDIGSAAVGKVLAPKSLVPTRVCIVFHSTMLADKPVQNAFLKRLGSHQFEYHSIFVPGILHEFELGMWKGTFAHLMQLLYAIGTDVIQLLNQWYGPPCISLTFSQSYADTDSYRHLDVTLSESSATMPQV